MSRQVSLGGFGQLNSSFLRQQAGGDQVEVFVRTSLTASALDGERGYYPQSTPHSREVECSSGCSLKTGSDPSLRVVSPPLGVSTIVRGVGHTSDRSFCHKVEQQASHVHLSNPGSNGLERRCLDDRLEQSIRLCLPTYSSAEAGSGQGEGISMPHTTDCAAVAKPVVVCRPFGSVGGQSSGSAYQGGSTQAAQILPVSFPSGVSTASRVDAVKQRLRDQGFSEDVSSRISQPIGGSSLAIYESKWRAFCGWCDQRKVDPFRVSVMEVADFLSDKFREGRAPSTIAGYRTAIAKTLDHFRGDSLSDNPQLSALLRTFERDRPSKGPRAVDWDLSLVLNALSQSPFEPMQSSHLKLITWKTAFLVMLASARRGGRYTPSSMRRSDGALRMLMCLWVLTLGLLQSRSSRLKP